MAERKLEVRILGDSRSLERALGRSSAASRKFGRESKLGAVGVGLITGAAAGATLAIGRGLSNALSTAIGEFQEQAKVSAQTAAVLKSTGNAAGVTQGHIEKMAGAIQQQTGLQDDAVQGAQNLLLTFTKISNAGPDKIFDRATQATADLSVALGKDMSSSAIMVGKALNDPIRGVTALGRAGVQFSASQRETIKQLVETGRTAEAQRMILKELETQVGGSARAFGESVPGRVAKAQRAFENMAEGIAASLLPAFEELLPLVTSGLQQLGPIVQRAATGFADLVIEVARSDAFRTLARAVRDLAVTGIEVLSNAIKVLVPIVLAVVSPIAALAAALTRSQAAMTLLTAAVASFVALRATAYVTGLVSAMRGFAVASTAAAGVTGLSGAFSTLTRGVQGVSAAAVGLAPGLTAAQGGISRMAAAGQVARGSMTVLGRTLTGALGGPVGIGITAATTLAVVIGDDLVRSFLSAKDPAERYADAMREAATGTEAAKDSLEGLASAILGGADAQDRTREATANRVSAERELRALEREGISSGPQYEAAVRAVGQARRGEAQATLAARDATDSMRQKQSEARTTVAGLVQSLSTARSNAMAGAQAIQGFGVNTGTARAQYQQFAQVANGKIMASDELKKFQGQATSLAGVFRNAGTPAAREIATALDNVGKARTPEGVAKWSAELVRLMGGSKREVDAARVAMNKDMRNTGNVQPSTSFFSALNSQVSSAMSGLEALGRKIAEIARKRAQQGGQGSNERQSMELASAALGGSPNLLSWFYSQRSAAAGAAGGLSGLAREGFLQSNPEARAIAERRGARNKELQEMTRREFQERIAAAETADERRRLEMDFAEFEDAIRMESLEKDADAHAQNIDDLISQFERGAISAETFQAQLGTLIGGSTGETYGQLFGERWTSAFEKALGSGSALQAIIARALGALTGVQPIDPPQAEAEPEAADPGGLYPKGAKLGPWRSKAERDRAFSQLDAALKRRSGKTRTGKEGSYRYGITVRPLAEGGILRRAVLAGEAGPEAVIPLTGTRGRDYMARVMEQVGRGSGTTVVVNVAGNEFSAEEFARKIGPELRRQVALTGSF